MSSISVTVATADINDGYSARLLRNFAAAILYRVSPNALDPINPLSLHRRRRPAVFFAVMLAVTGATEDSRGDEGSMRPA
jgi:hypothetical protein